MSLIKSYYKILRVLPDPEYFYIKNEYNGTNTFTLKKEGNPNTTDLEYSKDKTTWTAFDLTQNSNTVSLNSGEKLYMRSTTGFSKDNYNNLKMSCNQNYSVGGHIATLIDYQNVSTITSIPDYCFVTLFSGNISYNNKLLNVSNLSFNGITSIGNYSLSTLFYGSSITTPPDLSSISTLGSYALKSCFSGCTSLLETFDFTNITSISDGSLDSCFMGCTSLNSIIGVTNFTNVYERGMYLCFRDCTSLTTGLDISSITYITQSNNMSQLYQGCTNLNLATAPNISSWNTSKFDNWLDSVAAQGVVRKPANLTIPTDSTSGIPSGWSVQDY